MDSLYSGLVQPMTKWVDLRTIVIGKFGTTTPQFCFEQPLGAIPFGACAFSPPEPAYTPEFKHYSTNTQNWNAWCDLLKSYDGSLVDDFSQASEGWSYQALTRITNGFRFPICSCLNNPQPFYDLVINHPRFFADRFEPD